MISTTVPAGGRHLERPAQAGLAAQVGEVRQPGAVRRRPRRLAARRGSALAAERAQLLEPLDRDHARRRRSAPPRARRRRPGRRSRAPPAAARRLGHRHRARRPAGSTRRAPARRRARRRRAPPAGSWPVAASTAAAIARSKPGPALRRSAGARLAVIRRCGNSKPGVDERRPHPLARLAHRGVGQADERERRQPVADVDLDPDLARLDAEQGEGAGDREHGSEAAGARVRAGGARGRRRIRHARGATRAPRAA